jgi:hypothetical protein
MDDTVMTFKPPYMSFQTFWSFIAELGTKPLPPQIDRSLMDTKSGTDQANLTNALKGFGLIREDLTVEPRLVDLVTADDDSKKSQLAELVRTHYERALQVSEENGTEKLLHDAFRDAYGIEAADTRRKALTFFLHAARTAGIELSPHFPATRSGSGAGGSRVRRPPKRKVVNSAGAREDTPPPPAASGDSYKITLRGGGTVTVIVAESHFNLSKNRTDRDFVYGLVDAMTDYAEDNDQNVVIAEDAAEVDSP